MAVSGFQKLTLAAVLALCVALLLPKTLLQRRDPKDEEQETAQGRFPPMMHRHVTPEPRGQRLAGVRSQSEVKGTGSGGSGTGSGPGGKSNLAAQIIPVYGFGILLYILYILFKITSKGSGKPSQSRLQSLRSQNNKRKITDFELLQLQEKLRETELVMETIVNKTLENDLSSASVSVDQEQSLLQQLTDITRAMKNNKLVQDIGADWDQTGPDLAEDSESFWSRAHCSCTCPQTHTEETPLEDLNIAEEEEEEKETPLEDQQTAEEEMEGLKTDLKTTEECKSEKMEAFPKTTNVRRRKRKGRKE